MTAADETTNQALSSAIGQQNDPFAEPEHIKALRAQIRELCARFPDTYWRELDARREYPQAFVQALTEEGWLGALIPKAFGGLGLGLQEAAAILQEINQQGGYAGPAHAQMYVMGALLRHGSEEQKQRLLPDIAQRVAAPAGLCGDGTRRR